MTNHYELLEVRQDASTKEIKRAFRERAKQLHPDIAGETAAEEMRKLLSAYEILSDRNRRFEYDRAYTRFAGNFRFDYRSFLREQKDDPVSQARLVFFELLHLEEEAALSIWQEQGGLDFPMERYLDREDWMDCTFILAEELTRRDRCYEAFLLLVKLVREERRLPYFRHFMEDVETFLKELVRLRLRQSVDALTYMECLETLLDLGFSSQYEGRVLRSIAETLVYLGEKDNATRVFREALKRYPALPNTIQLRRKLNV
jgi:tetratricopeptide (TPR) repeat protein